MRQVSIACLVSILLAGCSSHQQFVDHDRTVEGRVEYERLRLADPRTGKIPPEGYLLALEHAAQMPGAYRTAKSQEDVQSETWQFRGPSHVAGRTRVIVRDRTDPNTFLAGSVTGGVYRSTNAGTTWERMSAPDQMHSVMSIYQDPRAGHEAEWYYSCGEIQGSGASITGTGVWKSQDGGKTWNVLPSTSTVGRRDRTQFWYTSKILIDPNATSTTLVLTSSFNGVLRSTDGGTTWSTRLRTNAQHVEVIQAKDGSLWASLSSLTYEPTATYGAIKSGIFRSTDFGDTWTDVTPSDFPDEVRRVVLASANTTQTTIYAIASTPSSGVKSRDGAWPWHTLWKYTTDGGWVNISSSIPVGSSAYSDYDSQGGYDMHISVSPHDTNLVILGGTSLYRSTNGFADNTKTTYIGGYGISGLTDGIVAYPGHYPDQHMVYWLADEPNTLYSTNDGGVFRTQNVTADTVNWESLHEGYHTSQFWAVNICDVANDPLVIGGMQDRSTYTTISMDPSVPWTFRDGGDGTMCFAAKDGEELFIGQQFGTIIRKLLNPDKTENTWSTIDPAGAKDYLFINPYEVDPHDQRRVYQAGGYILWRNNDVTQIPFKLDTLTSINWDSLPATRSEGLITSLTVSREPANVVYYGTTEGAVYKLIDAHQGSPVPVRIDKGMPSNAFVSCIAVDDHDANNILVTYSNYYTRAVFHSSDGGETWSDVSSNLRGAGNIGPIVYWARIHHSANGLIYLVATATGAYHAHELHGDMTVWSQTGASAFGSVAVNMIRSREADDYIVVGTHGAGVYGGTIKELPPRTPTPRLIVPLHETRGHHAEVTLVWDSVSGAVGYDLEFSTSPDFTDNVQRYNELKVTKKVMLDLEQGHKVYYWRVYAYAVGGKSDPSETWSFATAARSPDVVEPTNRQENVAGLPVSLKWTRVPEALSYDVEVATNLTFSTIVASATNVTDTTTSISGLASNTRYFWHVRSADADTFGIWCQRSQFTTGVLTSVQEDDVADQIAVAPDPANDHLVVKTETAQGMIEIVNIDGAIVFTTSVNALSTRIDMRHLATGMYTLRHRDTANIRSSSFRIVR